MRTFVFVLSVLAVPIILQADETDLAVGSATEPLGALFTVPLGIFNVQSLNYFELTVSWNPSIIEGLSVTRSPLRAGLTYPDYDPTFNSADSNVDIVEFWEHPVDGCCYYADTINGSGALAYLHFKALGVGTSDLTISDVLMFDNQMSTFPFDTTKGQVIVNNAVSPEPSLLLPLGIFLTILVGFHARRSRRKRSGTPLYAR